MTSFTHLKIRGENGEKVTAYHSFPQRLLNLIIRNNDQFLVNCVNNQGLGISCSLALLWQVLRIRKTNEEEGRICPKIILPLRDFSVNHIY